MKRKLWPKPEQPPEGMIFNPDKEIFGPAKFIYDWQLHDLCVQAVRNFDTDVRANPAIFNVLSIKQLHDFCMLPFNKDPAYNWRRKNGRT